MNLTLTVKKKLYGGFVLIAVLSALVGGIGYTQLTTVNNKYDHILDNVYPVADATMEMIISVQGMIDTATEYVSYSKGGNEIAQEYDAEVEGFDIWEAKASTAAQALGDTELESKVQRISIMHETTTEAADAMMIAFDTAQGTHPDDMTYIIEYVTPYMETFDGEVIALTDKLEGLEVYVSALVEQVDLEAEATGSNAKTMILGVAGIAIVGAVVAGVVISRGITNPLSALGLDAGEIASGNLDHDWTVKDRTDEIGEVITAIKTMVGSMKNTLNDVEVAQKAAANRAEEITNVVKIATEVSTSINDLSGKVLNSAKIVGEAGIDLASQAQNLSASMQQVQGASNNVSEGSQNLSQLAQKTVTNIDSLSRVFNQVNQNAENMSNLVKQSNALAQQVGENGNSALSSLGDIKSTNSEMGEIIGQVNSSVVNVAGLANDISDIADQVNMLALNAAVEAARAGEAGRGFAVVADAVKQLAGQTVSTARTAIESIDEITRAGEKANDMAKQSGEAAEKGNEVISQGVQGTLEVVSAIEDIQKMTESLTSLVAEGVKAIEEVSGAIQQVASFSEEAASASEESASSIEEQTASTEQVASTSQTVQEEGQRAVTLAEDIVKQVERLTEVLSQVQV